MRQLSMEFNQKYANEFYLADFFGFGYTTPWEAH
jgi:hypothetical protein